MHGEDSVKLFVGSLHARDLNMAAAIAKVAAQTQTVRHYDVVLVPWQTQSLSRDNVPAVFCRSHLSSF